MSAKVRTVVVAQVMMILLITGGPLAHAAPTRYIDPGTGGMLFQVLAVLFTALSGFIFLFSNRIKAFFNRGQEDEELLDEDADVLLTQMDEIGDDVGMSVTDQASSPLTE